MTAPLAFIDTETTGLHTDKQIWEVAIIRRDFDVQHWPIDAPEPHIEPVEERVYEAFVPVDLSNADLFGLNIGKFYDRHPRGRRLSGQMVTGKLDEAAAIAEQIARFTHGCHFIGAVPSFDAEVLAKFLRTYGLLPAWHYHLVDIENLAVGYLAANGTPLPPPWSSDALTAALGLAPVDESERHTALGDARWAQRVYDAVMTSPAAVR